MSYITTITNEFATLIEVLAEKGFTFKFEAPAIVHGYRQYGYCAASNGEIVVSFCEGGEIIVRTADHVYGDGALFMGDLIGPNDETGDLAAVIALVTEAPKSPEFNAGVAASKEENTAMRNNPFIGSADLESKLEWAAGWLFGYDSLEGRTGYLAARVAAYATHAPNYINGWSPVVECRTNKELAAMLSEDMTIEEAIAFIANEVGV